MPFSDRYGYTPAKKAIQLESMDEELRNRLWNAFHSFYLRTSTLFEAIETIKENEDYDLAKQLWDKFFKLRSSTISTTTIELRVMIENKFLDLEWYKVYDFIEFTLQKCIIQKRERFSKACNKILEEESAAYRIVNNQVIRITDETELAAIDEAITAAEPYAGAREHLSKALELLADRQNPDYRNSIKESISAVESLVRQIAGDPKLTLGKALDRFQQPAIHGSLKEGFKKFYGYSSDADGIRHGLVEDSQATFVDAKYMLVACAAFVNYLIGKISEQNLALPAQQS